MRDVIKIILIALAAIVGLARACKRCSSADDLVRLGKSARHADDSDPDFLKYAKYADLIPESERRRDGNALDMSSFRVRSYDTLQYKLIGDSIHTFNYKRPDHISVFANDGRMSSLNSAVLVTNLDIQPMSAKKMGSLGARLICDLPLFEKLQRDKGYEVFSIIDELSRQPGDAESEERRNLHYQEFINNGIENCHKKKFPTYLLCSETQQSVYGKPISSYKSDYKVHFKFYSYKTNAYYETDLARLALSLNYMPNHRPNSIIKYISDFQWRLEQSYPEAAQRIVTMSLQQDAEALLTWTIYTL